jgi:hypothetical protein
MNTLTHNENRLFNATINWLKNTPYNKEFKTQEESDDHYAMWDVIQEKLWDLSNRIMESGSPLQKEQMEDWAADCEKKWNVKDKTWEDNDL